MRLGLTMHDPAVGPVARHSADRREPNQTQVLYRVKAPRQSVETDLNDSAESQRSFDRDKQRFLRIRIEKA